MTERIWFTADTHFGHKFMLNKRINGDNLKPFTSLEQHDEYLQWSWNTWVTPQDIVYVLGDFSFSTKRRTEEILRGLYGRIRLVRGNHDAGLGRVEHMFDWVGDYRRLRVTLHGEPKRIILSHYPIESWDGMHKGSWHFHGHSHGSLPEDPGKRRIDVGWDVWFRPVSLNDIAPRMAGLGFRPVDHHTEQQTWKNILSKHSQRNLP